MHTDGTFWRLLHRQCLNLRYLRLNCKGYSSVTQNSGGSGLEGGQSICQPARLKLRKADRFFESYGPRAVLEESGVRIEKFKKLTTLPEVALLGRTSVGKSSLINALLHQKKLARTSKTPGHTRLINFFNVGSKFYLVDLPGYGYVEGQGDGGQHFVRVVEQYLKERAGKQLRNVCLLIDGKVGIKKNDLIAVEMLEEMNAPFHVVITKMDKISSNLHDLRCKQISKELGQLSSLCFPHVFPVSCKEKTGLSEIRYFMGSCTGICD